MSENAEGDFSPDDAADPPGDPTADAPGSPSEPTRDADEDIGFGEGPQSDEEIGFGEGPQSDEEMPLADHIEEMVRRAGVVAFVAAVVAVFAFPFTDRVINFLWYSYLPGSAPPHIYIVPGLLFTRIKTASLAGLILALPLLVYQTYRFMRPGLYPNERRYYLAAVPTSLVLAFVGVSFAYFAVLPFVFSYFLQYTEQVTTIAFALGQTFDLILVLMGYLAVVFQIPLLVMLALMLNVVSRTWMARRRLLFWGGFAGVSFLFTSVDPTGVSPILIGITMILLFEGTLLLAKWTGH